MAKTTFSNEQLCKAWMAQVVATPKGTRRDVVVSLMSDPSNEAAYKQTYNNVTQRVKQLAKAGLVFPALTDGKKGAKRTPRQLGDLAAILAADAELVSA
jgi:hypothetical protein